MKIAFCWDWKPVISQTTTWEDGLAAALRELQKRGHEVAIFMPGDTNTIKHPYFDIEVRQNLPLAVEQYNPDVILIWGDLTRPNIPVLKALGRPMALCFAGGETHHPNISAFNHIFVESKVYLDKLAYANVPLSIAFGTNTDLFQPTEQVKAFDTIFPATFALWKRHDLYAKATEGMRSLAVGYMYDDHEQECWQVCLDHGVTVLPHASAQVLKYLYAASNICIIPSRSDGGSQRTVLEALAMNMPVIVTDSDKFDFAEGGVIKVEPNIWSIRDAITVAMGQVDLVETRPAILANWSHITYADALEKGLSEIV